VLLLLLPCAAMGTDTSTSSIAQSRRRARVVPSCRCRPRPLTTLLLVRAADQLLLQGLQLLLRTTPHGCPPLVLLLFKDLGCCCCQLIQAVAHRQ
jgi:hypothetical protein